jgi:hypothetical protein
VGWLGALGWRRGAARLVVLGFGVGSGNDFSEVPVFRDLPAALDTESPLVVFPGPVRVSGWRRRGAGGRRRR